MEALITLSQENTLFPISAREMYEVLTEGKVRHYSHWSTQYIANNESATKDVDYQIIQIMANSKCIGRPRSKPDYMLSVDFAKSLALIFPSKRGREIRDYFIQIEIAARQQSNNTSLVNSNDMINKIIIAFESFANRLSDIGKDFVISKLLPASIEQKEKAEKYDLLTESDKEVYSFAWAAKRLRLYRKDKKIEFGRNSLISYLKSIGWIQNNREPYQSFAKYFVVQVVSKDATSKNTGNKFTQFFSASRFTPEGYNALRKKMIKDGFVSLDNKPKMLSDLQIDF